MVRDTPLLSKVLIVEDDAAQRRTLCDIMREEGFEPVACETAGKALERAATEDFAVAVVDYRLPDLSGTKVLERLRELSGSVRVILHTAFGSFESARDAVNLGAFAYLEKPARPDRLLHVIHRAVEDLAVEAVEQFDGRLRAITQYAPDGILQLDRQGTVTFLNRDLAGYTIEELLGEPLLDRVHEEHRSVLHDALIHVLDHGDPRECVLKIPSADGSQSWFCCRLGPVVSFNQISGVVLIARDVTEQKQGECIDELVTQLLRNARRAIGPMGKLHVETHQVDLDEAYVAEHPEAKAGPHVMIEVSDNGCGMSGETLDHMFEPFYSTNRDGTSAGLGLTRVYRLVAEAGGHIVIESTPGVGTVFRVYLPSAGGSMDNPFGKLGRPSSLRLVD
jgi:PAS domain S-box-containing protein